MKKNRLYVSFLPFLCVLFLGAVWQIEPIRDATAMPFFTLISKQMDKEDQERREKAERGEVFRGKDTALIWGKHYEIWHQSEAYLMGITTKDIDATIFRNVLKYKVIEKKLYVLAKEGYAVVDRDENCRVYLLVPETEYVEDAEGHQEYVDHIIEDEHITYLDSYEDFSEEERKGLEKVKKRLEKSMRPWT